MGEIFGEKFAKLITTTVINSKVSSKTTVDAIKRIFKVRFTGWNACMNTGRVAVHCIDVYYAGTVARAMIA